MQAALRFLQIVHRRSAGIPGGGPTLSFGGAALTFDGIPLTFQSA